MKFSVVIPARNEQDHLRETVEDITTLLRREEIIHEIVIVNDHSTDRTLAVAEALARTWKIVRVVSNEFRPGFGCAVHYGLDKAMGDAVAIVMADGSDDPNDLVVYYRTLQTGVDCVFGSRFIEGSRLRGYPGHKLLLNRLANWLIQALFMIRYNDVTNAFKCYRREVIANIRPILSYHFNITVELPLKAIVRGYSYAVVPIGWTQRVHGFSKLKIREMGSRYLFIVLYVLLERWLSRGDYYRRDPCVAARSHKRPVEVVTGSKMEGIGSQAQQQPDRDI